MKRKIVRNILTAYFNTKGFFFYLVYLWHPYLNRRLFYSKALGKTFMHTSGLKFMSTYAMSGIGYESYTQKEIKLTFKDLGLYKLKLLGGWKNGNK